MIARIFALLIAIVTSGCQDSLPEGFVYLKDIDPTIIQSVRYAGNHNFVGCVAAGYRRPTIILTRQAATALKKVQDELRAEGYSLVVYDGYRPERTSKFFVHWSQDPKNKTMQAQYYPRVPKDKVFELRYVTEKSGHNRGSAIDVTLVPLGQKFKEKIEETPRTLKDGFQVMFLDDGTVDMGTSFDLFDPASHHDCDLIEAVYLERRNHLREKMTKHGFEEFKEEWWHYKLRDEPYPDTYFDFEVN